MENVGRFVRYTNITIMTVHDSQNYMWTKDTIVLILGQAILQESVYDRVQNKSKFKKNWNNWLLFERKERISWIYFMLPQWWLPA